MGVALRILEIDVIPDDAVISPEAVSNEPQIADPPDDSSRERLIAVISEVIMSACWDDMRSVVDQLKPSINGGRPVAATSCSMI